MPRPASDLLELWDATLSELDLCETVTEWADRYRWLPRNASASPGPWRTNKTPYLRGPMDAMSVSHPAWKVVIQGSNQVGKSEGANNLVLYRIHQFPCPMLWIVPRDKDVPKYVTTRIDPIIQACPQVAALVGSDELGGEAADNAVLKRFPGGQFLIAGSRSPAVFRSDPIEVVVVDDLDACAANAEGDIVELAAKRTNTFAGRARKLVLISTPTIAGASRIEREFEDSSQQRYHVPCLRCGGYQVLEWSRLTWLAEAPHAPFYRCEHCDAHLDEADKPAMLAAGEWRPARPELVGRVEGFHLSALYSPWRSWSEIVLAHAAAKRKLEVEHNHDKMQVWKNLDLGEVFALPSQVRLEQHEREVYQRREPPFDVRQLPAEIVTVGADVQGNRLEATAYAWGVGLESWVLEHRVFTGAPEEDGVWHELRDWIVAQGARGACVDSSDKTQRVKDAVHAMLRHLAQARCAIWPVQGQFGHRAIWPRRTMPGEQVVIGVDAAKDAIFGALENCPEPGPGHIHFSTDLSETWFRQLFSERPATLSDRTRARYVKIHGRNRNEALDCAVYARAALYGVLALDDGLRRRLLVEAQQQPGAPGPGRPAQRPAKPPPPRRPVGQGKRRPSWIRGGGGFRGR